MPRLMIPARFFAAIYDKMQEGVEEAAGRAWRAELLAEATGATLEIGAGTGANLEHYPPAVTSLVLSEPEAPMRAKLEQKLAASGRTAEVAGHDAGALPYPDATFDTVVVTLVLCTVPDPTVSVAEIHRVLKPGGRLLFIEHVRSETPKIARRQDLLRPVQNVIGRGCNPNRYTLATIRSSGLEVDAVRRVTVPTLPRYVNEAIMGSATRAAA